MVVSLLSRVRLLRSHGLYVTCQVPLSREFSRQEYWSGLPFPSPGYLPNSGIEPKSPAAPALQAEVLLLSPQGTLVITLKGSNYYCHFKVKVPNHRYIKWFLWSCTSKGLLSWALDLGSFLLCHPASLYSSRDFFIIWACIHLLWSAVRFYITSSINKGIEEP